MTKREHLAAKLLEEDEDIRSIIQNQKVLPLSEDELHGKNQMAPLHTPQQLFGRPGRAKKTKVGELESEIFGAKEHRSKRLKSRKARVATPEHAHIEAAFDADALRTASEPKDTGNAAVASQQNSTAVSGPSIFGG